MTDNQETQIVSHYIAAKEIADRTGLNITLNGDMFRVVTQGGKEILLVNSLRLMAFAEAYELGRIDCAEFHKKKYTTTE